MELKRSRSSSFTVVISVVISSHILKHDWVLCVFVVSMSILCVLVDTLLFSKNRESSQRAGRTSENGQSYTHRHPLSYSILQVSPSLLTIKMASFSLPPIYDNEDKSWGPSSSTVPKVFQESVQPNKELAKCRNSKD